MGHLGYKIDWGEYKVCITYMEPPKPGSDGAAVAAAAKQYSKALLFMGKIDQRHLLAPPPLMEVRKYSPERFSNLVKQGYDPDLAHTLRVVVDNSAEEVTRLRGDGILLPEQKLDRAFLSVRMP
jgi:hypothetical protein